MIWVFIRPDFFMTMLNDGSKVDEYEMIGTKSKLLFLIGTRTGFAQYCKDQKKYLNIFLL